MLARVIGCKKHLEAMGQDSLILLFSHECKDTEKIEVLTVEIKNLKVNIVYLLSFLEYL